MNSFVKAIAVAGVTGLVALGSLTALAEEPTAPKTYADDPFIPPGPEVTRVVPRGPGEDYKSNPAPPEPDGTAAWGGPLTAAERQEWYETMDPGDSPDLLICINRDGSGEAVIISRVTGAEKEKEVLPPPGTEVKKNMIPAINDKGVC
jgi:hypothetical protein